VVNAAVSRRDDTIDIVGNSSLMSHDGGSKTCLVLLETWLANSR